MRITDQGLGIANVDHTFMDVSRQNGHQTRRPTEDHPLIWLRCSFHCQLPVASFQLQLASSNRLEKCCNEAFTIANELITTASGINTCLDLIEEPMPNVWQPKSVDIYGISIYVFKGGYPGECNIGNRPHWSSNRSAIAFRLTRLLLFFLLFYLFFFF